MRVIHVTGYSGSGKTTLITHLIPLFGRKGPVAVIKHMHHHLIPLPEGKDTTIFTVAGAECVIGIDADHAHMTSSRQDLPGLLALLCEAGAVTCFIEGFKDLTFPAIRVGDDHDGNVILVNPEPGDVIAHETEFPAFLTPGCMVRGLMMEEGALPDDTCSLISVTLPWLAGYPDREYNAFISRWEGEKEGLRDLLLAGCTGGASAELYIHQGRYFGGKDVVLVAIRARDPHEAFAIASRVRRGEEEIQLLRTKKLPREDPS